ncbi:type VI secretion system-associated FHA domain protein TagH [Phaeovulum sp. W22_SRMD_FR3]|uniref:type VI secretion system-associated FHA domain protein TagH n=1 Tax=Phaeovulum sp. W22_SRMD_FR3 TaxID=3240274 RepID=UPI003F9CE91D
MTVTLKFQSSGMLPGDARPVRMQGNSLTVGRGPANDLVLPDPDRMLSKSHCVIEDHGGNVVVVDLSTNGTFLNYAKMPLGRVPTPLSHGDVICLGGYELVVEIESGIPDFGDLLVAPAAPGAVSHGRADRAPDPLSLLDDAGPGGDFLDDLLGDAAGPKGPGQIKRPDPFEDLLPPLGEEADPFFRAPDDGRGSGSSLPMHNPGTQDSFAPPVQRAPSLIPDDWDDLLSPTPPKPAAPAPVPPSPAPVAAPPVTQMMPPEAPVPASAPIPHDPFDDIFGEGPLVPPAAPPPPEPLPVPPVAEVAPVAIPKPGAATLPPPVAPIAPAAPATAPAAPSAGSEAAAQAFLTALEVEGLRIDAADLTGTMGRLGRMMRLMITGLREILMTRTSIKSEFRIDQTMISAGGNNPLKFSISPEQAIEALVRPTGKGYLDSGAAVEQALNDIKAHEMAMVTGMEAALKGVLAKLDPEVLAGRIEVSGGLGSILKGKKARYWEVYEKMYAEISDQAENDFHELFSREFARAYKQQLDKLK